MRTNPAGKWMVATVLMWVATAGWAQAPVVVPVDQEPMHKRIFENASIRAFAVEVPPKAETKYHRHDRDYMFVVVGDSEVESTRVNEPPVHLTPKDGDVQWTKGGFAHKARNLSDKPFKNVTIELKAEGLTGLGASGDCRITARGRVGCEWIDAAKRDPMKSGPGKIVVIRYTLDPGAELSGVPQGKSMLVGLTSGDAKWNWAEGKPPTGILVQAGGLLWMDWTGSPEQRLKNESGKVMRVCVIHLP
ncbi:MAG: hypothetical protein HYX26_03260 [Acidobacteriales bacterium]|nr:hypothetical protein [Terriglobales bacterium]